MEYFDTHCHLDFPQFDGDRQQIIEMAERDNVKFIINAGINIDSCLKSLQLAKIYKSVFVAVGIHPSEVDNCSERDILKIAEFTGKEKVVALGEIGLDFYYRKDNREKQIFFFQEQLKIAGEKNLPVIIHQRESRDEIIEILEKMKGVLPEKIVFHCFGSDKQLARYCMENGFYISFTGIITFKKADSVREIAKIFPIDKILAETDAPYLSPSPFRGKRNIPSRVRYVVEEIARQKGGDFNKTVKKIFDNSIDFFSLNLYQP